MDQSSSTPFGAERSPETGRETDLDQLRERLAFYENFDKLIQDNISRAGDLLREAAASRGESELAVRTATDAIELRHLEEKQTYRRVFSSLLDQIQTVQQNVERLAREVSDALDDLESGIPAAGELAASGTGELPPLPRFGDGEPGYLAAGTVLADEPSEPESPTLEPIDEIFLTDEQSAPAGLTGAMPSPAFSDTVQASVDRVSQSWTQSETDETAPVTAEASLPESREGAEDEEDGASTFEPWASGEPNEPVESDPAPGIYPFAEEEGSQGVSTTTADAPFDSAPEDLTNDDYEGGEASTILLVHGVPRATTALSLKRYLEGLPDVHSVEPREYAEGVLRLQVSSGRPIGLTDLHGWSEAAGMETVSVEPEFVEVRLPH